MSSERVRPWDAEEAEAEARAAALRAARIARDHTDEFMLLTADRLQRRALTLRAFAAALRLLEREEAPTLAEWRKALRGEEGE